MLATYLYDNNISSFRFDKRSVGKSTSIAESDVDFHSFVSDVSDLINYFDSDFEDIILLGHSEGVLIGSMAGQSPKVSSFIAVSGISKSLDKVVLDQLAKYPKLVPLAEKHFEEIKTGQSLSEVTPLLQSLFRPSIAPFLKSVLQINPIDEIAKLDKPVLILNGTCDLQVTPDHATALHEVTKNSQLVIIENMGHAMKELQNDCGNAIDAYSKPEMELNTKIKTAVIEFLNR